MVSSRGVGVARRAAWCAPDGRACRKNRWFVPDGNGWKFTRTYWQDREARFKELGVALDCPSVAEFK